MSSPKQVIDVCHFASFTSQICFDCVTLHTVCRTKANASYCIGADHSQHTDETITWWTKATSLAVHCNLCCLVIARSMFMFNFINTFFLKLIECRQFGFGCKVLPREVSKSGSNPYAFNLSY